MKILLVVIGSGLGGALRYLAPCWIGASKGFPWATLAVNVVGSVLIGLFSGLLARHGGSSAESIRAFAVVGFCGGFTTFSTFSNETFRMLENNQWLSAAGYVGLSVAAGFAAVFVGHVLAKGVCAEPCGPVPVTERLPRCSFHDSARHNHGNRMWPFDPMRPLDLVAEAKSGGK